MQPSVDEKPKTKFYDYNPKDLKRLETASKFYDYNPKLKKQSEEPQPEQAQATEQVTQQTQQEPWTPMSAFGQTYNKYASLGKGIASGASIAFSEQVPGLQYEGSDDDVVRDIGEFVGAAVPIGGLHSFFTKYFGAPALKLAAKSPIAKDALTAIGRMTVAGMTFAEYEGLKHLNRGAEDVSVDDLLTWGVEGALLDGALRFTGNLWGFAKKVRAAVSHPEETIKKVLTQLGKEKLNPEIDPRAYAERAEQILEDINQKDAPAKTATENAGDITKRRPERVQPQETQESLAKAKAKAMDMVDQLPPGNLRSLARKAVDREMVRTPEQLDNFVAEYEEIFPDIEGKMLKDRNRKFMNKYASDNTELRDIKAGGEPLPVTPKASAEQKLETGRTEIRQAKMEGDIAAQKAAKKKIDLAKKQAAREKASDKAKESQAKGVKESPIAEKEPAKSEETTALKASSVAKAAISPEASSDQTSSKVSKADHPKAKSESASIRSQPSKLEISAPKASKEKKPKKPVYVDMEPSDVDKTAREIISKHVQSGKEKGERKLPKIRDVARAVETELYNRFAPLKDLDVGTGTTLDNARKMAELAKGFASKAEANLKMAQYDAATGEAVGPAFQDIFLPERLKVLTGKKKLDRPEFDYYLASKTSLERQQMGQKNPIPTAVAESFVRENRSKYEPLAQDIYKFGRNQIKNLTSEGILTKDGADAMFKLYQSHVPLYRVMPEELNLKEAIKKDVTGKTPDASAVQAPGMSSLKVQNPIKGAKGSDLRIKSPTESIVRNAYATENAISRNRAMKAAGRGLEKQGYEVRQVNRPKKSDADIAEALGMDVEELGYYTDDIEAVGDAIEFLNPEQPRGKLRWYEDGNLMEVNAPKDIIQAVEGLSPQQADFVMTALEKWKSTFTAGVVLQPGTLARLGGMDMVISTLQSKYPKQNALLELPTRVFYEYPRMLFNILGKTPLFEEYMQSGAGLSSMRGLDRDMLISMTDTFTNAYKTNSQLLKETLNIPKKLFQYLKNTSEVLGDVPRLLEFERSKSAALEAGASKKEALAQAAFDAFEVSVPYGRKGANASMQNLYRFMPFINTIVNSGVSFAKALNPSNPLFQSTVATAVSYLTIPTLYQYHKNRNDPRYQALTQRDKDTYVYNWNTDDPDEEPFKMRKFWQFGYLFQTLPEHIYEFTIQRDPKALAGLGAAIEYEFSPLTMLSFSNAFSDGKFSPSKLMEGGRYSIIPERQKKIDAELQSTASTSETAKILAKWFHISPIYIDHIVQMTGGGLGKDVLRIADEAVYMSGYKVDKRPAKQTADNIFWGTFWGRGPSRNNKYVTDFYDYIDKFETAKASEAALRKEGKDEEADKYAEKNYDQRYRAMGGKDFTMAKMRKAFAGYYKAVEEIRDQHPDDLNGVEKRKELNQIYRDWTDLAKEYTELIEEVMQ